MRALDAALDRWADVVAAATGQDHRADPGAGAAGGVGFAAVAVLGAALRPGVQFVLETIDFPRHLRGADLVVTGEGSLDAQTLNGKAPAGVAEAARAAGIPVVAVAGRCTLDDAQLRTAGFAAVYSLLAEADSLEEALERPGRCCAASARGSPTGSPNAPPIGWTEPRCDPRSGHPRAARRTSRRRGRSRGRHCRRPHRHGRRRSTPQWPANEEVTLGDDEVLLPGLVDTHVHVNEPGRTDWEGFDTATRAAAAGGVTTIIDMPLNSIPATTTLDALELKQERARSQAHVDVGFWGGAVPGNLADLAELHEAGVFGFKCFLIDSGVAGVPAARRPTSSPPRWPRPPGSARCSSCTPRTPPSSRMRPHAAGPRYDDVPRLAPARRREHRRSAR